MENSEARKKRQRLDMELAQQERRREVVRDALAAIYSGPGFMEADAFLDALGDLGARVEVA